MIPEKLDQGIISDAAPRNDGRKPTCIATNRQFLLLNDIVTPKNIN